MKNSLKKDVVGRPEITVEIRLSSNSDLTCDDLDKTLAALIADLNDLYKDRIKIKGNPERTSFQRFSPDFYCEDRYKVTFSTSAF